MPQINDSTESSQLGDIIADLNVSIADMETLKSLFNNQPNWRVNLARAIGQLKAARGCLIVLIRGEVA